MNTSTGAGWGGGKPKVIRMVVGEVVRVTGYGLEQLHLDRLDGGVLGAKTTVSSCVPNLVSGPADVTAMPVPSQRSRKRVRHGSRSAPWLRIFSPTSA